MKYAYFPGCSLHAVATDYGESTVAVAEALGIELIEVPDWVCCGATPAHATDDLLSVALPVRTLIDAGKISSDLVVCCAACYSRFKFANKYLEEKEGLREDIREILGEEYSGEVRVRHFLDVLINDVGLDTIKERAVRNLGGLKIASYYGCLMVRPPKVVEFDDPEDPRSMDELVTALGGEAAEWPYKNECCGASFSLTKLDIVLSLAGDILKMAKGSGAECILVACPFCHANIDMRERDIEKKQKVRYDLPVIYFTQLLGLCLGVDPKKLGLHRAMLSSQKLLKAKGVLS